MYVTYKVLYYFSPSINFTEMARPQISVSFKNVPWLKLILFYVTWTVYFILVRNTFCLELESIYIGKQSYLEEWPRYVLLLHTYLFNISRTKFRSTDRCKHCETCSSPQQTDLLLSRVLITRRNEKFMYVITYFSV
jgi:hypothetical protein